MLATPNGSAMNKSSPLIHGSDMRYSQTPPPPPTTTSTSTTPAGDTPSKKPGPDRMSNSQSESTAGSPNGTATPNQGNGGANNSTSKQSSSKPARRIDSDALMGEFRKHLGPKWPEYRQIMAAFLTGKLTRTEMTHALGNMLDQAGVRMHNQFLLANLTNALRDPPGSRRAINSWSQGSKDKGSQLTMDGDPKVRRLKEYVMSLSRKERRRLKMIDKDLPNGKRSTGPLSTVSLTRQSMLPKIPVVKEREKQRASWTQDIIHEYQAPLSTELYELPDQENLRAKMQGIAIQSGLLGGVSAGVPDFIMTSLELYLKDLLQQTFDRIQRVPEDPYRDQNGSNLSIAAKPRQETSNKATTTTTAHEDGDINNEKVISAEDIAFLLRIAPSTVVEFNGPLYKLFNEMLQNEDDYADATMYDFDMLEFDRGVYDFSTSSSFSDPEPLKKPSIDSNKDQAIGTQEDTIMSSYSPPQSSGPSYIRDRRKVHEFVRSLICSNTT